MRQDYADITLVLDASGSMSPFRNDTIGGVNKLIAEQKAHPGFARFTLVQFNTGYWFTHNGLRLAEVPDLQQHDYAPEGNTALRDAMGRAIIETGKRLADLPEHERPARVLFVTVTDGEENASNEVTQAALLEMVKRQTEVYQWEFLYLGANVNAFDEAGKMGIAQGAAAAYGANKSGLNAALRMASKKMAQSRTAGVSGQSVSAVSMSYTTAEREELASTIEDSK